MAPNDHQRADALDRYWDAVLLGDNPSRPHDVDEVAAAVVARLGEHQVSPYVDAARVRIRQALLASGDAANTVAPAPRTVDRRPSTTPRLSSLREWLARQSRWRMAALLAATTIVVLISGILFGPLRPDQDDGGRHGGPAINAPASPTPDATPDDTVLKLTLPVDALPTGDGVSAGLGYFSIPPGNSSTWISKCCRGPMIEYVVTGEYTVTVAAAIEVFRADGSVERIPANTVATLGPGDSLLSRNETEAQAVNNGTEPVEIVQWTFVDDSGETAGFRGHLLPGWIDGGGGDVQGPLQIQPLPTTIELRLVDVQDGDSIVPPPGGWLFVVGTDAFATDEHSDDRRVYGPYGQSFPVYFLVVTQGKTDSTATGESGDAPVFQTTLPVTDLPTTDRVRTVFDHLSIPPGETTGGSSNCCSGPMIEYVISGSYAVIVAAPIEVIRANGTVEQIPANTEVALGPGDSLISRSETPVQITVAGPEPAELLNWILVDHSADRTKTEEHVRHEWLVYRDDTKNPLTALPRTPVTVRIRMVVVPNGDSIAAPESGMQFVMPVEDGSFVARLGDGSTQVFGEIDQPVTTYILSMEQPGTATGTPPP